MKIAVLCCFAGECDQVSVNQGFEVGGLRKVVNDAGGIDGKKIPSNVSVIVNGVWVTGLHSLNQGDTVEFKLYKKQ